ncbi:MAG: hypothetical protein KAH22_05565 [Thiotrichaceae bacterium]|nr:hypothetical protein [Thiotrichaceae bacterium]
MLNKIIFSSIQKVPHSLNAMTTDIFENPSTYTGIIYPLRYLLALRYQKLKLKILQSFRLNKIYPIANEDYQSLLTQELIGGGKYNTQSQFFLVKIFQPIIIYPLLLITLALAGYHFYNQQQLQQIENVITHKLPYFSDLLHQKLLLKYSDGNSEAKHKGFDLLIDKIQQEILDELPERYGIKDRIAEQIIKLKDPTTTSKEILLGFKSVNKLFDEKGIPFYLSPKSFSVQCSSLIESTKEEKIIIKKIEKRMEGLGKKLKLCRTTMMTAYKVSQRNQLYYRDTSSDKATKKIELPLFHVERIDKVPAVDGALGLTFKDLGHGSIILNDRISHFEEESVLPALTFQGRKYIIPYWIQGDYEIEEAITKGYTKDLFSIYTEPDERTKIKVTIKKIIKNKERMLNAKLEQTLQRPKDNTSRSNLFGGSFDAISTLLTQLDKKPTDQKPAELVLDNKTKALLKKLNDVILPSIEYHEAYHQIDKKHWQDLAWIKTLFKEELTADGIDHTLEELGAYLSQLASTEKGHNIWLSKILIFSLNPMTKGQAEYFASSMILNAMDSMDQTGKVTPHYDASVNKKIKIYKKLSNYSNKEIRLLAQMTYEALFERSVPELKP